MPNKLYWFFAWNFEVLLTFKDIFCFLSQIMTKLHYLNYFSKVSLKRIEQTKHAEPKSSQLLCYNLVSTEMEISFISPGRNILIFVTRKANYKCISLFGTSPPQCTMCILGTTMALWSKAEIQKYTFWWEKNVFEAIFPMLF